MVVDGLVVGRGLVVIEAAVVGLMVVLAISESEVVTSLTTVVSGATVVVASV